MNAKLQPSKRPGMGAVPYDGGTTFRVWAPHASQVFVSGEFNDWSKDSHPLAQEENGYWSVDVPEAKIGAQYRYILWNGDQELSKNDPYARALTNSTGNSIIVDRSHILGDETFQMPAWNDLVIYEAHIGTFNKKSKDGPGTLRDAIEKLPYLRDLGINAIEVMPLSEFPGDFSWGYNPAHPFSVESRYGGPDALKAFIKAAHEHGIAVIIDVVYNHFGPGDLDIWQFDGWSENDKGGIYFYNDWRAHTPWGESRPDYGRAEVRQYIRDNALMWLEEYQADGLRFDATAFIRNVYGNGDDPDNDLPDGWSLLQWIHEEIQARMPWKVTIAEDFRDNAFITRDVGAGGAGFSAQWDGAFVHPIRSTIILPDDASRQMNAVRDGILHIFDGDAFKRVIYTESHDEVANGKARVPEEIWPGKVDNWFSKKRSTLGAALVLTSPGIPLLFQGQEFLEDRWFHDQDPLEWTRAEKFEGLTCMYQAVIRLRRNLEGTTAGLRGQNTEVHHVNDVDKIIAYHRWDQGGPQDSVIVIANMANREHESYVVGFPRPGMWKLRFNSDWDGYDESFGNYLGTDIEAHEGETDGMAWFGNVRIGPYSVLIYSQDE